MPIYGYSKQVLDPESGLLQMAEISLELNAAELRRVAEFLSACANEIESGTWKSSHRHIPGHSAIECDVIVIHPNPEPPKRGF